MSLTTESELFQSNNHSKFEIGWKNIDSDQAAQVGKVLGTHYGYNLLGDILQVNEWEKMSNNFLVSVAEEGEMKKYLLRKNLLIKDSSKLQMMEDVSVYLRQNDIPVPLTIPTKDQAPFCFSDNVYWQLFEFISGQHFSGTFAQLEDVSSQVAKIHLALKDLPFETGLREKFPRTISEWRRFFDRAGRGNNDLDKSIVSQRSFIMDMAELVNGEYSPDIDSMQPIHGDLHPQNTIYMGSRLAAFLDFADVGLSERARDCGSACHRFVRQYVVFQNKPWQQTMQKGVELFFRNYNSRYPLSVGEKKQMPVLILDEILRKLHVGLSEYYNDGNARHLEGGDFEKKISLLKEAQIIGNTITSL